MNTEVKRLVVLYDRNRAEYLKRTSGYNESDTRADFVDPFFAALGWDVANTRGLSRRLREVIRETHAAGSEHTKRPDYEFKLGPERKFFVEVKKPSIDIANSPAAAFQVRRYGWSADLAISVVTNFEYLAIYDTAIEPQAGEPTPHARIKLFHYTEYCNKLDEIAGLLSRDAVYSGQFDTTFVQPTRKFSETVDAVLLQQLNRWRLLLGEDILRVKPHIGERALNELAQRFLLRVLFLRMCEDRGIETYELLRQVARADNWDQLVQLLIKADRRFDSELFDTRNDPLCTTGQDGIRLNHQTVEDIVDALYFPAAPYTFAVFKPQFLGSVYEHFLQDRLKIVSGRGVLTPKPENEGRDIVPTPQPLVDRIVQDTLGPRLAGLSVPSMLDRRILDIACGSGGFLISAFDLLADAATTAYVAVGNQQAVYRTADGWQLTFEEKCKLLQACIYGVDRDDAAVEVARFSLLVKLLEDETPASLPQSGRILPSLARNVVVGDSLVDDRLYTEAPNAETVGPPLTWGADLPRQYDFVVGNPPYLKTEAIRGTEPTEYAFYLRHYDTAYRQFDKYYLFLERAVNDLLKDGGALGMVISRKFSHIESGKALRRLLSKGGRVTRIVDFGNAQLFDGRTTYTCLLYLSKTHPSSDATPLPYELVTTPREWVRGQTDPQVSLALPRHLCSGEKAWLLPGSSDELALIEAMYRDSVPLGSVADAFNGIQTSRNDVYVITRWRDVDDTRIAFEKTGREWLIEKRILKSFFEGGVENLNSFHPLRADARVIFPYDLSGDAGELRASLIPPSELQQRFPLAWTWLEHNQAVLKHPPRDIRPAPFPVGEWYRYGRDQALTAFEDRPKIVVGINSLGNKYVYDDSNALLASGGTAGECAIAAFRGGTRRSPYSLYFILALLNHKAVEYFCRKRGSPFRGGWYARGTAVLKEIPVPSIELSSTNARSQLYAGVVETCQTLCRMGAGLDKADSTTERTRLERRMNALKREMDAAISTLYGIMDVVDRIELPT